MIRDTQAEILLAKEKELSAERCRINMVQGGDEPKVDE